MASNRIRSAPKKLRLGVAAACAVLIGAATAATADTGAAHTAAQPLGGQPHQVATWGASADRTDATSMAGRTIRNIVHTSVSGEGLRISLSNAFGAQPVTFDNVWVGTRASGAAVDPGTNRQVKFSGSTSITVPPGAEVLSDPLEGKVPAGQTLAVSIHAKGDPGTVTGHNVANQTSYLADGNHASEEAATSFTETTSRWYWVDALVVDQAQQVGTVVTFGDSITDGNGSTSGANRRWPDFLARRMQQQAAPHQFGVMNQGVSGNRVLTDGSGVNAQARFDRDVLAQPGVETVVLMEGINDIRWRHATSPEDLTSAYQQLISRAHARGICVVGATLTPWEGGSLFSEDRNEIRKTVNEWIRTSGAFDAVVDFDKVTRDPGNPDRFLPAYDSGDHLHPGDKGYEAMANAVNLDDLSCDR